MISLLVVLHAVLMLGSLLTTGATTLGAFSGYRIPSVFIVFNLVATSVGVVSGIVLMLHLPLDIRCVTLAVYVGVFAAAQVYLFRRNQELSSVV